MTSRRCFLTQLYRSLLGVAALELFPLRSARAIAPLVVIGLIQTAMSVANLFSHGGNGVESLMHLQVEMLNQIKEELVVIEKGIEEILNRLSELKELLGELPRQVAIEENRATINGLTFGFNEIRNTYLGEGQTMSSQLKVELYNDVISPIRKARNTLMSYPQPQFLIVPAISTACFVETYAMALDNTSPERAKQAHISYRKWFVDVSGALSDRIKSLQRVQHDNWRAASFEDILEKADPADYSPEVQHPAHFCYTEVHEERDDEGLLSWKYKCEWQDIRESGQPLDDETQKAIEMMEGLKLLERYEEPVNLSASFEEVEEDEARYTGDPRHSIGQDSCPNGGHQISCSDYQNAVNTALLNSSNALTSTGLQLMSLHALKLAAESAISFIDRLEPAQQKSRPS